MILTNTGREHYLSNPPTTHTANVPSLREIAHSLAQINRFTGHCSRPYSVAEHSLLVARIAADDFDASPAVQLAALMHDAHECITGDVASPVKALLGQVWADFEDAQQKHLLQAYQLDRVFEIHHRLIKQCDLIALATERRDLMRFDKTRHQHWPPLDTPGQMVSASWLDLNDRARTMLGWKDRACAFEAQANTLLCVVHGDTTTRTAGITSRRCAA
jgi:hypothetical protein